MPKANTTQSASNSASDGVTQRAGANMAHRQLASRLQGRLLTDEVSRGQYATDASVYQIMPQAVVLPESLEDVQAVLGYAQEQGISVLPRGGGTSQNGQTVNDAIVIDNSRHLNRMLELDVAKRRCVVQAGMVLDELNRQLKPHGLWFPVDVSTASRATIGGMCGNNSCGQRSLVYGTMRHNVRSLDAMGADGSIRHFGSWQPGDEHVFKPQSSSWSKAASPDPAFVNSLLKLGQRYGDEVQRNFPKVLRRVGGYNLDTLLLADGLSDNAALLPAALFQNAGLPEYADSGLNLSGLMVGSEGTLGCTTAVELQLAPLPGKRVLGVCHFPTFYQAMDSAQHLVALNPTAVELVDSTMIQLARDIDSFRPVLEQFVRGTPAALLLVEFACDTDAENQQSLARLSECMGDLGFSWGADQSGNAGGVVEVVDPGLQAGIADVRTSGLNIMMSMKSEGKPVSFVEDCAVDLADLAEYTDGLTEIFEKHGTRGTWYAHASVGCLHVRPVLNLKLDKDLSAMREMAEEAFDLVLKYKGSHSGEHGDGISRSEFHRKMFGAPLVQAFSEVKQLFDPQYRLNPGKIVNAPAMNDRQLLRYHADYQASTVPMRLDWSAWPEAAHGLQGAVEMCNNNGACRKLAGGAMCPSYRATRNETDVTRGRANALRLALSGQLNTRGCGALASDELYKSLELCVSCKACKRECPTGVDMAKMKLEVLAAREAAGKHGLHEKLVAGLPVYAHKLAKLPTGLKLLNSINRVSGAPLLGSLFERLSGFSSQRALPAFSNNPFRESKQTGANADEGMGKSSARQQQTASGNTSKVTVIFWADTFNRYFEPQNLEAALNLLDKAGYKVLFPTEATSSRPLCCGRTWLSTGKLAQARRELQRTSRVLLAMLQENPEAVVVGLEPSCLLTFRDELGSVLPGAESELLASRALLFEEFLVQQLDQGQLDLDFAGGKTRVLVHGHCHQKAFAQMDSVLRLLRQVPDAEVSMIESSCCGMAGSFGYGRKTADVSRKMAELSLLPAINDALASSLSSSSSSSSSKTEADDIPVVFIADGTSCRHQIKDCSEAEALHVACWLNERLLEQPASV